MNPSYSEIKNHLNSARQNWLCALNILKYVDNAEHEIALYLSRAWYALSCAMALDNDQPLPDFNNDPLNIDPTSLPFPQALPKENWQENMALIQTIANQSPDGQSDQVRISVATLRAHCDFLGISISAVNKRVRKKFGISFASAKAFRKCLISAVVVVLVLITGYLIYRVQKGPELWRVQFFENKELHGSPRKVTKEYQVDSVWTRSAPKGFPKDNFSIRWDTCFVLHSSTQVKFTLGSDDGSRLIVDGDTVINHWSVHAYETREKILDLPEGIHHLEVEYFQEYGGAQMTLTTDPEVLTNVYLAHPTKGQQEPCNAMKQNSE